MRDWREPNLAVGWDVPAMRNSRLLRQRGFFVYNVDVTHSLGDDLEKLGGEDGQLRLEKWAISPEVAWEIRRRLKENGYSRWRIYWDGAEDRMQELTADIAAKIRGQKQNGPRGERGPQERTGTGLNASRRRP